MRKTTTFTQYEGAVKKSPVNYTSKKRRLFFLRENHEQSGSLILLLFPFETLELFHLYCCTL